MDSIDHGPTAHLPDADCEYAHVGNSLHASNAVLKCKRDGKDTFHACNSVSPASYWFKYGNMWHCVDKTPVEKEMVYKCSFDNIETHPYCNETHQLQPACCRRTTTLDDTQVCSGACKEIDENENCVSGDTLMFTGNSLINKNNTQSVMCTKHKSQKCNGPTMDVDGC